MDDSALVHVLGRIADELAGIRAALEVAAPGPASEPPTSGECQHPDECRNDFSAMGGGDEWECAELKGGCGKRYPQDFLMLKVD